MTIDTRSVRKTRYLNDDSYEETPVYGSTGDESQLDAATEAEDATVQATELSSCFISLFEAMDRALKGLPENLVASLKELPPVGTLPDPWAVWLLLSICAHLKRQEWGRRLLKDLMPEVVPPCEAFCHMEGMVKRQVPEHPEWEVLIDVDYPQKSKLTNRTTHETFYVDVSGERLPQCFDLTQWLNKLRKNSNIDSASRRLLEFYPWPKGLGSVKASYQLDAGYAMVVAYVEGVEELEENGLIEPIDQIFDIPGDSLLEHEDLALNFLDRWKEPEMQLWCSALVGDWLLANRLAIESKDADLIRVTALRAAQCRRERIGQVLGPDGDWPIQAKGYYDLYNSEADDLDAYVQQGLDGSDSAQAVVAEFLTLSGDSRWCEAVLERLSRAMQSNENLPDGLLKYLLGHGYRTDDVTSIIASRVGQKQ